jgi:hypothetical protein
LKAVQPYSCSVGKVKRVGELALGPEAPPSHRGPHVLLPPPPPLGGRFVTPGRRGGAMPPSGRQQSGCCAAPSGRNPNARPPRNATAAIASPRASAPAPAPSPDNGLAVLRAELEGLRLSALQARAAAELGLGGEEDQGGLDSPGVSQELEAALDSDAPHPALVRLILAERRRKAERAEKAAAREAAAAASAREAMEKQLCGLKISALQRRARQVRALCPPPIHPPACASCPWESHGLLVSSP